MSELAVISDMLVPFLNSCLLSYFFLEIVDLTDSQPLALFPLLFKSNKSSCRAESLRGKPSNVCFLWLTRSKLHCQSKRTKLELQTFFYSRVVISGSEKYYLRIKKVALTAEAFTGGVLLGAFEKLPKVTVKHLRWSLFLIKLQAWWCATLSRRKNSGTGVFLRAFWKF